VSNQKNYFWIEMKKDRPFFEFVLIKIREIELEFNWRLQEMNYSGFLD
jgi:hypothetical protein